MPASSRLSSRKRGPAAGWGVGSVGASSSRGPDGSGGGGSSAAEVCRSASPLSTSSSVCSVGSGSRTYSVTTISTSSVETGAGIRAGPPGSAPWARIAGDSEASGSGAWGVAGGAPSFGTGVASGGGAGAGAAVTAGWAPLSIARSVWPPAARRA